MLSLSTNLNCLAGFFNAIDNYWWHQIRTMIFFQLETAGFILHIIYLTLTYNMLDGGFKCFLFSSLFGEMIQFD